MKLFKVYGFSGILYMAYCYIRTRIFYRGARIIRFPFDMRGRQYIDLGSSLTLGRNCRFEVFPHLRIPGEGYNLKLGHQVQINDNVHICAMSLVEICDNVLMASNIYISDNSHGLYNEGVAGLQTSPDVSPIHRDYYIDPVRIEKNVWICQGVVVNPGVTIGEGSIIGANSVVTHSIPPYSIAVGAPAKVIKRYDFTQKSWIMQKK